VIVALAPPVLGVAFAFVLGGLVIALTGRSPAAVAARFAAQIAETYEAGSLSDLGDAIYYATVYMFSGLAVAYALQAGLFNIGGEGQLIAGGFAMGVAGAALPASTPALLALLARLAAGVAGGAAWAAVPAFLRARLGVHEVLATILMNLMAPAAANFLLGRYRLRYPDLAEAMHTRPVVAGAHLTPLDEAFPILTGSHASTSTFLALAAAVLAWFVVYRTRTGYELRAVGLNPEAARAGGVPIAKVIARALLVSGGLAGLAATPFVLGGSHHYYEQETLSGAGFTGIAVAVLAGNNPARVVIAALLMGVLTQAGEVVNGRKPDQVPKEIVLVLQAVVILSVLVAQGTARRFLLRAEARQAQHG
jgi:simple sugar transport system permease protein